MNPTLKMVMLLIIALEISFTLSLPLNLMLIGAGLLYMIKFAKFKKIAYLILITLIPASGIYFAQMINGDPAYAGLLVSRLYAFVILGGTYTCNTSIEQLAASLEQNFHLPAKFAYGVMGAFNLVDTIKQEINDIKVAAQMRNVHLTYYSPTLYFKAILSAMNWSSLLAQGMNSHLFVDNHPRSHYRTIRIHWLDYAIFIITLSLVQIILFIF